MLYPLYLVVTEMLLISTAIKEKGGFSAASIFKLCKLLLVSIFVFQLLSILSLYSGLGYSCLFVGLGALTISSSDELIKLAAPVIAPQIASIGTMLDKVSELEMDAVKGFTAYASNAAALAPAGDRDVANTIFSTSVAVEELAAFASTSSSISSSSSSAEAQESERGEELEIADNDDEDGFLLVDSPVSQKSEGLRQRRF